MSEINNCDYTTLLENDSTNTACFSPPTLEIISSPTIRLFILTLYTLTTLLSLFGNLTVIVVLLYDQRSNSSIRHYLLSLAASDLIIGAISVPTTYSNVVLGYWLFPDIFCSIAQYAQLLAVFVTSSTLTTIGIERYIVAIHPISRACHYFRAHNRLIIALIWLLGGLYAYVLTYNTYTSEFEYEGTVYTQCIFDNQLSITKRNIFAALNFIFTFILPLVIMSYSYCKIMQKLNDTAKFRVLYIANSRSSSSDTKKQLQNYKAISNDEKATKSNRQSLYTLRISSINSQRSNIIKMLYTIIIVYTACWLPIKLFQFLQHNGIISYCSEMEFYLVVYLYITFHLLAMVSSFINCIIYSFLCNNFRIALRKLYKTTRTGGAFTRKCNITKFKF